MLIEYEERRYYYLKWIDDARHNVLFANAMTLINLLFIVISYIARIDSPALRTMPYFSMFTLNKLLLTANGMQSGIMFENIALIASAALMIGAIFILNAALKKHFSVITALDVIYITDAAVLLFKMANIFNLILYLIFDAWILFYVIRATIAYFKMKINAA